MSQTIIKQQFQKSSENSPLIERCGAELKRLIHTTSSRVVYFE